MTQLEILKLAQEELLRRFDFAQKTVQAKPCDVTKEYRDNIATQCVEIRHMIIEEFHKQLAAIEQKQAQQMQPPYHVIVEYADGHRYDSGPLDKEPAMKFYNKMKGYMGETDKFNRVSFTKNGMTLRSYERSDF